MKRNEAETPMGSRCEIVKCRVTVTATGLPAEFSDDPIVKRYIKRMLPALEPGWFWMGATPASAADLRRRGLRAVGTATTTFIPPQDLDHRVHDIDPESIPPVGSREWSDLMLAETREREVAA